MTEAATVTFEEEAAPEDDVRFAERVASMRMHLDDPAARFSASGAVRALNVLRAYAGTRDDLLSERREILSMIGRIVQRAPLMRFEDGLEPMAELMAIGMGADRPAIRRLQDHHIYAELASGHASQSGETASHSLAADQYAAAAAIADTLPDFTDDQRAAIRERQAYELHEAGRFEEALAVNRQVLATGERIFGPDDPVLATVLTNLAQNLHALGRRSEIEPYLVRVQRIGEAEDDLDRVQDMLFQRGVLAYELGFAEAARSLMLERIARLETAGDTQWLSTAREDHAELERRLLVGE